MNGLNTGMLLPGARNLMGGGCIVYSYIFSCARLISCELAIEKISRAQLYMIYERSSVFTGRCMFVDVWIVQVSGALENKVVETSVNLLRTPLTWTFASFL